MSDETYMDGKTAAEAIKTLGQVKDKPFFLAVGFRKPHLPFVSPKKYWDLYKRESIHVPDNPQLPKDCPEVAYTAWTELRGYAGMPQEGPVDPETTKTLIHAYRAAASYTDAQIGKVIRELDRLGLREKTIIVVVADHGWKLGEHGLWSMHTNFELDTRVPLILSVPGQKVAGKACPAGTGGNGGYLSHPVRIMRRGLAQAGVGGNQFCAAAGRSGAGLEKGCVQPASASAQCHGALRAHGTVPIHQLDG